MTFGYKSSTVKQSIALNAAPEDGSGIAGILRIFGDDGGVVPGDAVDINQIESRFLVGTDLSASACSIKALRGHLRVASGKLPSGSNAAVLGYLEIDGTSLIGVTESAAVMAMVDASGTVTGASNKVLSAFCACSNGLTLGTARSTVLHVPSAALFTSLLDAPVGGFIVSGGSGTPAEASGQWYKILVYIGNSPYYILAATGFA